MVSVCCPGTVATAGGGRSDDAIPSVSWQLAAGSLSSCGPTGNWILQVFLGLCMAHVELGGVAIIRGGAGWCLMWSLCVAGLVLLVAGNVCICGRCYVCAMVLLVVPRGFLCGRLGLIVKFLT